MKKNYLFLLFVSLGIWGYGQTCPTQVTRTCAGSGFFATTAIEWAPGVCTGLGPTITYTETGGSTITLDLFNACTAAKVTYYQISSCDDNTEFTLDLGNGVTCLYDNTEMLPVTLSSFNSKTNKNNINLLWRTEAEFENAGFEIQRSSNSREWETIVFIEGQGSTIDATDYTFTDEKPLKGMQYYRLNQVDYDGKSTFSKVISVKFQTIANVSVYPNPAKDRVFIDITATGINTASVFDNMGRKVLETTLNESGIDISSLDAGIYFVQITNGNLVEKIRFIKE